MRVLGYLIACVACLEGCIASEAPPPWQAWLEKGQPVVELEIGKPLPEVISGENFTAANLQSFFTIVAVVDESGREVNITKTPAEDVSPQVETSSMERVPWYVICEVAGCSFFKELYGNKDFYDMRPLKARAFPKGVAWEEVSGFKQRKLPGAHYYWKNLFGINVIDIWFEFEFEYGGQVDNTGAYISQASSVVSIENGFLRAAEFSTKAYNVRNLGTSTGPVAAIDIEIVIFDNYLFDAGAFTITATVKGDGESWCDKTNTKTEKDKSIYPEPGSPSDEPCFEGSNLVRTPLGLVEMKALRAGDLVEATPGVFEPIILLPQHWTKGTRGNDNIKTEYLSIEFGNGTSLLQTEGHMIFAGKKANNTRLVRAGDLQVGDWVQTETGEPARIMRIQRVQGHGAFTPYTPSLKIVVSGLQTSCLIDHPWALSQPAWIVWRSVSVIAWGLHCILPGVVFQFISDSISFLVLEPVYYHHQAMIVFSLLSTGFLVKASRSN